MARALFSLNFADQGHILGRQPEPWEIAYHRELDHAIDTLPALYAGAVRAKLNRAVSDYAKAIGRTDARVYQLASEGKRMFVERFPSLRDT